ncbi:MAG: prepilin-type N-terminal cleavage/methylation domain-containing protein [Phycisphaerales bacterium]|nr:type II secretion system GspH family protein [Phycisphaerae bacterium]NNF41960.1 prepilin-type N-terminal cleavage/methylation domain-containing protein [Phycisphaerales bacterium]NNM24499.1 prepilin-type N-terminal cleavage/methylation domain-containing protein [Phycisphaerales bacterium]
MATPVRPGRRAFSMLEIVITLLIASTLFAIAAPRYVVSLERFRAESAARRVVGDLEATRKRARATGVAKQIAFDLTKDAYTVQGITVAQNVTVKLADAPYLAGLDSAVCDNPIDASDAATDIVFDAYGVPDSAGTIVIRAGGITETVVVDPYSGRSTIQ